MSESEKKFMNYKKCNEVITSFAKKLTKNKELQKDLIQEGYVGLLKAEKNYDSTLGVEFLTYAYPYIKDHISRYYKKNKEQNVKLEEEMYDSINLDSVCFDDVDNFLEGCSEDTKR